MLLSAAFGFIVGEAYGDRPLIASASNKPMRIFAISSKLPTPPRRRCKSHSISSAGSSNGIHKRIVAVTKRPRKTNGRISPIRPSQKL